MRWWRIGVRGGVVVPSIICALSESVFAFLFLSMSVPHRAWSRGRVLHSVALVVGAVVVGVAFDA